MKAIKAAEEDDDKTLEDLRAAARADSADSTESSCRASRRNPPLLSDDHPTRPFESVSADFFVVAGKSLVVVDRLKGWPVVVPCKGDTTSVATIRIFCRYFREVAPSGNIDCEELYRGLLELRNTPNLTGRSPAQILYGHPLRSCVPAHPQSYSKEWQAKAEDCDLRAAARAEDVTARYDQHAHSPFPGLMLANMSAFRT
ncbi:hypothetical protein GWK47_043999 [Chionoecetes opilio]|uniref:Uncharacterized protein n=1 Tax=Chionoecetes opilio TaxID=41210 RepID=A0A8J4YH16_CHIOP|nr:hypothetical protein GWK47_043999 [Chionoecetes opilio]